MSGHSTQDNWIVSIFNQGFITVFNQVLQTIDGDKSCHQSRVRFSFCKTDINLIDLGRHSTFWSEICFEISAYFELGPAWNEDQLNQQVNEIQRAAKNGNPYRIPQIICILSKRILQTFQCKISFSWAKTRNAFYSNCRTFAHPSSDLGVASWIQIERTTQPAKQ